MSTRTRNVAGLVVALFGASCFGARSDEADLRDDAPEAASAGVGGSDGDGYGDEGDDGAGFALSPDFGTGAPPPEVEQEADFRVPRASGAFVYSASETTDSVAVIDSSTLTIEVVAVGRGPTVIAPLAQGDPETGAVAVLDQRSDDLALLETGVDGRTAVRVLDVSAGANNLTVSPDGKYVFVYVDVDGPEELGSGSDQELSVVEVKGEGRDVVHLMTVGAHPRDVVFSPLGERSFVITADGVNVIETADIGVVGKPDIVPVYDDFGVDPSTLEIQVAPTHAVAIARVEGQPRIVVTDLSTGEQRPFALDRIPTDLDIASDDAFALLTVPGTGGSQLVELALPLGPSPELRVHEIEGEYVGIAQLSSTNDTAVFYTSQAIAVDPPEGDEDGTGTETGSESSGSESTDAGDALPPGATPRADARLRFTIGRRVDGLWDTSITLFADRPIRAVGIAPDGKNAILVHEQDPSVAVPHGYTLVDLGKAFPVKKFQTVEAPPEPILFTPEGDRAVVLLRADPLGVRRIEQVDLRTFIVETLDLGSPPEGAGYVDATDKVFVSQDHPTGRITFVDRAGAIETVTGFRLNDAVKD